VPQLVTCWHLSVGFLFFFLYRIGVSFYKSLENNRRFLKSWTPTGHFSSLTCFYVNTLNSLISVEIIHVGHIDKLELAWVEDPGSFPESSWRLPLNTLHISCRTKIAQNKMITHIHFLGKMITISNANFSKKFSVAWNQCGPHEFSSWELAWALENSVAHSNKTI
jgi:hypothetical protein